MEEVELEMVFNENRENVTSEWDKLTPIVETKGIVSIYLNGMIDVPEAYNELYHTLRYTETSDLRMIVNSNGGNLDTALSIIQAMKDCDAEIVCELSGTVASAATMIALNADKLEIAPHTAFMIHSASGGISGKTHETKAYMDFSNEQTKNIFNDVYKDFLTQDEIDKVLDGKDMWMNANEVMKRWNKMGGK